MNVREAIEKRRSIRRYAPTPIPEQALNDMLEAARLAPSGGNGQNCYFGVVTDLVKKKELAVAAGEQMWIAEAPVVIALCSAVDYNTATLPEDDFSLEVNRLRYGHVYLKHLESCPDQRAVSTMWANGCPLIPGTHMTLVATSYGLDTCWIGYLDVQAAGQILGLPENLACLYLLPVGYPAEDSKRSTRRPLKELVFHNTWEAK